MPTSVSVKPIEVLLLDCTRDIRWEFDYIRSRISSDEIHRLADNLLCKNSPEWPLALFELQKGKNLKRLLDQLNFKIKVHGFSYENPLIFKGPFPTLSLRSLQATVEEYRSTLRAAHCVEFLGNKAWNYSLKSIIKRKLPFQIDVATLTLEALGCSKKYQIKIALRDLSERIKGCILNFLYDWERLLTQQTCEQLLIFKQNAYLSITEAAV